MIERIDALVLRACTFRPEGLSVLPSGSGVTEKVLLSAPTVALFADPAFSPLAVIVVSLTVAPAHRHDELRAQIANFDAGARRICDAA
ncbi:MAG TPA: hypothetical protein VFA65_16855 [Bryobacteraceae bacterium]|nr:hypothetical protein [Bryobacteraceae bacterium]